MLLRQSLHAIKNQPEAPKAHYFWTQTWELFLAFRWFFVALILSVHMHGSHLSWHNNTQKGTKLMPLHVVMASQTFLRIIIVRFNQWVHSISTIWTNESAPLCHQYVIQYGIYKLLDLKSSNKSCSEKLSWKEDECKLEKVRRLSVRLSRKIFLADDQHRHLLQQLHCSLVPLPRQVKQEISRLDSWWLPEIECCNQALLCQK